MEPVVYTLLFLTSLVGLTFIVERGLALRWRRVVPPDIEAAVQACQARSDVSMLRRVCEQHDSPMSRLLLLAAGHLDWPKADNMDALQTRARQEITRLERGLVVLEIIVGIAPLLGLVGTIIGMMSLFGNIGQRGLNEASRLAQGIAVILNTTLMGLLIAIPSSSFGVITPRRSRPSPSKWRRFATSLSGARTARKRLVPTAPPMPGTKRA